MAAVPLLEEMTGGPAGAMISELAGLAEDPVERARVELLTDSRPSRRLAIYPAAAGFDLIEELDHLAARALEPNVFFNPRFLAPAMPRLEDREVRLAVIRDGSEYRNRLRLLLPFSIERPTMPLGVSVMRSWSHPFGPAGTPLIDSDNPDQVMDDFLTMVTRPHLRMPKVLVLPDMHLDGAVAGMLRSFAASRDLTLIATDEVRRAFLESKLDGEEYLKASLRAHHFREFRRLKRRLGDEGALEYRVARQPDEIRAGVEAFLALEASGWKGRERTAMVSDRYQAAFAREAAHLLSQRDMCRVHLLLLDGRIIASLIVFVAQGIAYTWKTAYDESYSAWSPGTLLMIEATKTHLDDPNIQATDSCAAPDHIVMDRLWSERRRMGTLVLGVTPQADRAARQAAKQLHLYHETRNMARLLRERVRQLVGRR
jgi:CelD/BcsL family acetyltransferase involved in cellulose biosynthesis